VFNLWELYVDSTGGLLFLLLLLKPCFFHNRFVCWYLLLRSLTSGGTNFVFIGNCADSGLTTKQPEALQKSLKQRLKATIDQFEGTAQLMIIFATLIHIPYLVVMAFTRNPVPSL
jgi:hypothetical protein